MEREKLDTSVRWEETLGRLRWVTLYFFQGRLWIAVLSTVIFHQNSEIQLITFECLLQMQFIPALGIMRIELRSRRNFCISLISGVFILSYS